MQRIKRLALILFLLPVIASLGHRFLFPTATGQSGVLAAPTGVVASDSSYSTKVGLTWDTIRGATVYQIFRNTTNDPATAISVGSTAAPNFFDPTAVANQTYFYWVRAENGSILSPLSAPDTGVRANGAGGAQALNPPPIPPGNLVTATKASLGKALFWDEQLSSTRTVACGTCHHAGNGGSDPRSLVGNTRATNAGADNVFGTADDVYASPGVPLNNADGAYDWSTNYGLKEQVTGRKSLSYINAGYSPVLFWDGRATPTFLDPITNAVLLQNGGALENQVLGPPLSSAEMAHVGRNWTEVASRVAESKPLALSPNVPAALQTWIGGRSYPELFNEAFGTPDVTPARIAFAIATFERTLYADRTPWDAAVSGIAPLTAQEQRGQGVFNANQCNGCHTGALFSDNLFHNIGLRPQTEDTGRFQVTGNSQNLGEFRTPSLRNAELRGPYMHNGHFQTLEEVVEFYNRGGDFNAPNKDPRVRPRGLSTQQKADLVAFLKRPLTDPRISAQSAPFDRPILYSESTRMPQVTGAGTPGAGGAVPQIVAIAPPLVGNPNFTVAISAGLANAQSILVIDDNDPGAGPNIPANASFARMNMQLSSNTLGGGYGSVSLAIPNDAALVGKTFWGRWYVMDSSAPNGVAATQAFKFTIFGEATAPRRAARADFDGDGKTDISVFRPTSGDWLVLQSSNSSSNTTNFGVGTDVLTPADFDGDGKTNIAVFRPSTGKWYTSTNPAINYGEQQFGQNGDLPDAADYDGDGKADLAVFRPSNGTWYILRSHDGLIGIQFGQSGDKPVAADYDGDGKADPAVYRNGIWYILGSSAGFSAIQFGVADDRPVYADYDGDGKTDVAVFRPSTGFWYYLGSSDNGFRAVQFGVSTDLPSPGDYDGDGKSDLAVFRPSEGKWYVLQTSNNSLRVQSWGVTGDASVPGANVP
ncbi:MAG TPA: cytochrome c peroxidase [Pyrinomonadaceae bacterium]|jgi:cytochrome c peroxidase